MRVVCCCTAVALSVSMSLIACAEAAERSNTAIVTTSRKVVFELTFKNSELNWLGDPASPAALAYLRPGAQPIATDVCVTTLTKNYASPTREYMREARIADESGVRTVYAFTERREKVIGSISETGQFQPNDFYQNNRELLSAWPADASELKYDEDENALYRVVDLPGPRIAESLDFLPLELTDEDGNGIRGHFFIDYEASDKETKPDNVATVTLAFKLQDWELVLATAAVPNVFRRDSMQLGSFDNESGTYVSEAAYRGNESDDDESAPSVTVKITGEFTSSMNPSGKSLVVVDEISAGKQQAPAAITIDGNFDDWRNIAGVDDVRGDMVSYLEYVPDVDLLEFKVAHDERHIYLYARVAGQVGRSHPKGGRSYFYAYIDVDQNPGTGFLPSRDDECYYGVDIGDDCEVQFEFIDNTLRKTFYGFCGLGGDDDVLRQQVTIGKSQYGRFDENGAEREHYKSEYIYRGGVTEITEDFKLGTSDSIRIAISPDGSEVEVVSSFDGFLKDPSGRPTVSLGQTIDLAAGMECDSKLYLGKTKWAADSTPAIRGYRLRPAK